MDLEVLAPKPQRFRKHRIAHAPGRGADLAPNTRHGEYDGLGDLIEDNLTAPDITQPAQAEHAELRLQQMANLIEPVFSLVDPTARIRAGIGQEPRDVLCCRGRRMHLDC